VKGVRYVSFHEPSGYGESARAYMLALARAGVPVTWTPLVWSRWPRPAYRELRGRGVGDPELDALCNRPLDVDTVVVHTVPEYFPAWRERTRGQRLVGYTVWETDRLPRAWPPLLESVDALAVPSAWSRDVIVRGGVSAPVHVVPHLPGDWAPSGPRWSGGLGDGTLVFYSIGPWTERKAPWLVVAAFLAAFTASDPVALVVKTSPRPRSRGRLGGWLSSTRGLVRAMLRRHPDPPPVIVLTEPLGREAMGALQRRGDCYVSLSRAEGFNLPLLDAAAMGKPVIATAYGAHLELLPPGCGGLVACRSVAVDDPAGAPSYTSDQRWAEPDVEHAAALMRAVLEDRAGAAARGRALAGHVDARFAPAATLEALLAVLEGTA
jgi:glycosyltransferase involved in cell wall biosynthesis